MISLFLERRHAHLSMTPLLLQVFRWTFGFLSDQHIQCESKKLFLRFSEIVSPNG